MKKILFPTDFSKSSLNAFPYALHLAKKMNAEIISLHVYDLPSTVYSEEASFMMQNYNMSEWDEFENFKSEAPKLRKIADDLKFDDLKITHMLERGNPGEDIVIIAKRESIDYIVLGTTGATGLKEILIGSVAQKVIRKSSCIVLAIPESCKYRDFSKVLFLTQFQRSHIPALEQVSGLASLFNAAIEVVEIKRIHEDGEEQQIQEWKDHFAGERFWYRIMAADHVEDMVTQLVETEKINLIAIPVRQKNLFERLFVDSLSKHLAYRSTVPILAVPYDNN